MASAIDRACDEKVFQAGLARESTYAVMQARKFLECHDTSRL